jgi:hypothetical protein
METSRSAEQIGSGVSRGDGAGEISENKKYPNSLGFICLNLFNEDMSLINIHRICGKDPMNGIDLTNVHFLTVDFLTISQLKTDHLYTENELEKISNDMSGFIGIALRFYTRGSTDTPYGLSRNVYACTSKKYPLNVYKYDCVKYHLLTRCSALSINVGGESENESEWYGDSSDNESLSSYNEDDSENMSSSKSSLSSDGDDDDVDDDSSDE